MTLSRSYKKATGATSLRHVADGKSGRDQGCVTGRSSEDSGHKLSHSAATEVLKSLSDFSLRVHDKGTVRDNWLVNRLAAQEQELGILGRGQHYRISLPDEDISRFGTSIRAESDNFLGLE
jgi:hypothetical protein